MDVAEAIKNNDPYDPHSGSRDRGRYVAIKKDSREAAVVTDHVPVCPPLA